MSGESKQPFYRELSWHWDKRGGVKLILIVLSREGVEAMLDCDCLIKCEPSLCTKWTNQCEGDARGGDNRTLTRIHGAHGSAWSLAAGRRDFGPL